MYKLPCVCVGACVSVCSQDTESALGRYFHKFLCISCMYSHRHMYVYLYRCVHPMCLCMGTSYWCTQGASVWICVCVCTWGVHV